MIIISLKETITSNQVVELEGCEVSFNYNRERTSEGERKPDAIVFSYFEPVDISNQTDINAVTRINGSYNGQGSINCTVTGRKSIAELITLITAIQEYAIAIMASFQNGI